MHSEGIDMNLMMRPLDMLTDELERLGEEFPDMQRALHETSAEFLKQLLNRCIVDSGIKDSNFTIRRYQLKRVGSLGGYAAVSPMIYTEMFGYGHWGMTKSRKTGKAIRRKLNPYRNNNTNPNAITAYLEMGHKIRRPHIGSKNYRPRINTAYVNGFRFYGEAYGEIGDYFDERANELAEQIAERLKNGTYSKMG